MFFFNQRQVNRIEETLGRMEDQLSEMSDAVANLKKEWAESLVSIQTKLDELRTKITAGGDVALVADINAISNDMDQLQKSLAVPEEPTP